MQFISHLVVFVVLTMISLLWARWSKLDLGFSGSNFRRAEPWVLIFILWGTAEWAITMFLPIVVDPDSVAQRQQFSLAEDLIVTVLLGPVAEELFFRGAMFAAILRRWGIRMAVIVPSLMWAIMHSQYGWWVFAWVAGSGVLLAMVRWKSGSLYLPVGLHAAWNLLVTLDYHGLFGSFA